MTTRLPGAQRRFEASLAVGVLMVAAAATGCGSSSGAHSTGAAPSASVAAGPTTSPLAAGTERRPTGGWLGGRVQPVTTAAVMTAMREPMTQLTGEASDCIYVAAADHSQQLLVRYLDPVNMANVRQQIESSSEHVDGIGDDAFWNGTADLMFVRRGQRAFNLISVALGAKTRTNPDAPKAAMVALASSAKVGF